jgi:hypothetical protein
MEERIPAGKHLADTLFRRVLWVNVLLTQEAGTNEDDYGLQERQP